MTTEEYNKCVDDFSDNVFRFILKSIKDEEKARDIVQDAYEKLWLNYKSVTYTKAKSYIFTTAYHTMIDLIRREKRFSAYENLHASDSQHSTDYYSDLSEILSVALSKLPENQRSVLLLRDYEGYSYKEIGEIANLTETQVKVYIYRARLFVKQYIGSMEKVI